MSETDAPTRPSEPLVGRDLDLAVIHAFLRNANVAGDALLILGDPGVGKSVLLDAATEMAAEMGTRVLRVSGAEFEAEVSFAALNQVVLPLRSELSRLGRKDRDALSAAVGLTDEPCPDRLVISTATLSLLQSAAEKGPVLVVVDDVPWLDRASAVVFGFIARRVAGTGVGFLATARTGAHSFFERGGFPEYELLALDDATASALVSARFPTMAPRVQHRVVAEAAGNPLALLELSAALNEPQRTGKHGLPGVLPLGRRLHAVFEARIQPLPRSTRSLLLLAALEGTGDVRVFKGSDSSTWLEDLAPAEEARLVRLDSRTHRLEFHHPLIRSAVVELATTSERHGAHRRLAALFADDPVRKAWHLAELTVEPDGEIAGELERAARLILGRGDAVGAITVLTRAAELSPMQQDRSRLLVRAAFIGADTTGDMGTASQLFAQAQRAGPASDESLVAAITAAYLVLCADGDIEIGHRLLVAAINRRLDDSGAGPDPLVLVALENLRVVCQYGVREDLWAALDAAIGRLEPSVGAGLMLDVETGDDPAHASAEALVRVDNAIRGLADEDDAAEIVRVASHAFYVDRLWGCRDSLRRAVDPGRGGSAVVPAMCAMVLLGFEQLWAGDWTQAKELADKGVVLSQVHGYRILGWTASYCQALLAAVQGDETSVRSLTGQMAGTAVPRGARMVEHFCRHARGLAALGRADFEDAYQLASAVSPPGTLAPRVPVALWVVMDLVEAAVRTGRHREAAAHVAALHEGGLAAISPRIALLVDASAALVDDDDDRARAMFTSAVATPGADRFPFDLARVELVHGERLRRARATVESRLHLTSALATFERLGARPWAERASKELRATGQTRMRPHADRDIALTPQEREIATLAAAGLTNKEIGQQLFLSPRTVGSHLYRVFPKLGITSRAALRDALGRKHPIGTA